ncbi:lactonase family protein [Sphingobium sp. CAP-1]|uniref:lactonase family protein n=1 Tax=Sphingobium sp. CAP-1 TaxID=2676077 RepID=UPI0018AD282E|nr:lactonase family protein [Sphingobium sp. CAP-1]
MPMHDSFNRRMTRRCVATAALAAMALSSLPLLAAPAREVGVYVGTHGSDIQYGRFDQRTGALVMTGAIANVPRPTWTIRHPRLPILYSVNEEGNDGAKNGSIFAFRINARDGSLTRLNEVDAQGGGTTYLALDALSNTLIAANYGGGSVATFPILKDGSIGPAVSVVAAAGSGPHRRQTKPHAHSVMVDPSGRFLIAADLGADRLFVYPFDGKRHAILPDQPGQDRHFIAQPGSGPRHIAFHPRGHFLYLINELTAQVQAFSWDATVGRLALVQTISTNAPDHQGDSSASEILVSRDGRFLYAGNRGENSLLVYAIDRKRGTLSPVQRVASGGNVPWGFAFDPSGHWLLVANEKSDRVNIFAVDRRTGRLRDSGQSASLPKPVSFSFAP